MARHALVRTATGVVENVVEWDGSVPWPLPAGYETRLSSTAQIGGRWTGSTFEPAPGPAIDPLMQQSVRCRDYVLSISSGDLADRLDAYLANASPTTADTVAAVKETVRTLRALIRVVRGMP